MVVLLLVVVLIALLIGLVYVLMQRGATAEGANVDASFDSEPTFDEEFHEAIADATPAEVAHAKPEPGGTPPVAGAQWDEVSGVWIRWDETSQAWVPVAEP